MIRSSHATEDELANWASVVEPGGYIVSFRGKVLLILLGTAIGTNALSVTAMYFLSRHLLFQELRSQVLSIASTTAALVDGDLHEKIRSRADEDSPGYKKLADQLRRARNANRRDDIYVKYLQTFTSDPLDPGSIVFGVDPEETRKDKSHPGDPYHHQSGREIIVGQAQADSVYTRDQWGTWLGANAPLRDGKDNVVAAVAADVSAAKIEEKLRPVVLGSIGSLGFAAAAAAACSFVFSSKLSRPLVDLRSSLEAIGSGKLDTHVPVRGNDEFNQVNHAVNTMVAGLRERETVKSAFARYVSRQVMDSVLASGKSPILHGDRCKVTVLFCDIRGFTSLSENMPPEDVVLLLNEYFEHMVDVIIRHNGTLDKFMGDGLMALFGAPVNDPYQEEHAVRAALEMQQGLQKLSARWEQEGRASISVGIGINSGSAIVGNIGSSERMDYTAVGDTVNLAARLESATREIGAAILISEYTYAAVKGKFRMNRVGPVAVKGRTDPVITYAVNEDLPA